MKPTLVDAVAVNRRYRKLPVRRRLAECILGVVALSLTGGITVSRAAASPFIQAQGTQLTLNGSPYTFVGYNNYRAPSMPGGFTCGSAVSDAQLDQMMAQVHSASGGTIVRTWFFQSYENGSANNFAAYDRVLAAAAAHGIRIVATLTNQWGACEPGHPYRDLSWYQSGYLQPDSGYALSFKDFAVSMAAHYANDDRIAFWQLVNEAEAKSSNGGACNESAAAGALRSFGDTVTQAIHSVDPNHLVSLGEMGGGQCGMAGADYSYVHAGAVQLCEYHDYNKETQARPQHLQDDEAACGSSGLNKPLFNGEAGIRGASGQQRASEFDAKLNAFFSDGGAGFLIWSKSGSGGQWDIPDGDPTEAVMLKYSHGVAGPGQSSQAPTPNTTPTPTSTSPSPTPTSSPMHCTITITNGNVSGQCQ